MPLPQLWVGEGETKPYPARIFHELLSRDHEDGRATWQPSRGTAGLVRGVPERYVAGADTRGRQEGRPYPWSQQVIHEISGLDMSGVLAYQNLSTRQGKRSLHLLANLWHFVRYYVKGVRSQNPGEEHLARDSSFALTP